MALEQENSASVSQFEEQADAGNDKVMVDYELDINYDWEWPDPSDEPVSKEEKEKCRVWENGAALSKVLQAEDDAPWMRRLDLACTCSTMA